MVQRFGHNGFCRQGIGSIPRTAQTRGAKYTLQTLENQPSERSQGRQSVNLEESPKSIVTDRFQAVLYRETRLAVGDTLRPDALSDDTGTNLK